MKIYCLELKEEGKIFFYSFTSRNERDFFKWKASQRGAKWQSWTLNTRNRDENGAIIHEQEEKSGTFAYYEDKF